MIFIGCTKDTIHPPGAVVEQEKDISESMARIDDLPKSITEGVVNTEQGDYGPFEIGSWWDYSMKTVTCDDVPPYECDSMVWTRHIQLSRDTLINNRRYLGGGGNWYFMQSGKYYHRNQNNKGYKNGFLEILYLDENKEEGETWTDTAAMQGFPPDPNALHVFHRTITHKSDSVMGVTTEEEFIINGRSTPAGYPKSQIFKKGVGLFDRSEFRDWGTYSFDLTDYHIVR